MIKKNGKIVQLSIAALLLLLAPVAIQAQKLKERETNMPKLAAGSTYVTCYFGDTSNFTWQWALAPNNSYYSVAGDYNKSPLSKIERFVTTTPQNDIMAACAQSKAYYKVTGNFFAAFAAAKAAGYNYPILSNGTYLFPQY
jgi:hypothetical protein